MEEKEKSFLPLLNLLGSKYTQTMSYGSEYEHKFILTLKLQNQSIKNLKVLSNFWYIARSGGTYDQSNRTEVDSFNIDKVIVLTMYRKSNLVPFIDNILTIDYYDESNRKYLKKYSITKNLDDIVILDEIIP